MHGWLTGFALCLSVPATAVPAAEAEEPKRQVARRKPAEAARADKAENAGEDGGEPTRVVLSQARHYRLDVEKLDASVNVALTRRWVFGDAFPKDLLAPIKKSPLLRKSELEGAAGDEPEDSGYIRWPREEKGREDAGALLWYAHGEKRTELILSVDLRLDHSLGEEKLARSYSFDQLLATVDLKNARISSARWGDMEFPGAKSAAVDVEDDLQVSITGMLTDRSSASVRGADRLLADEISTSFRGLWRASLANDSHHGIALGWLGYEHLRHGLLLTPARKDGPFAVRYTVSGSPFPLDLVRRQLRDEGWPLVLRGTEYVGSSQEGVYVFRPVEYRLSRNPAKEPAK